MKKILFLLFLLLPMQIFAQYTIRFSTGKLINSSNNDSVLVQSSTVGITGTYTWYSSTSRDTIYTKWIVMQDLNGDFTFRFRKLNVSGTDTVRLTCEVDRGSGFPDSSGITIYPLVISNTDTTMTFNLGDSTWVSKNLFQRYRYKIEERAAQSNQYILVEDHYSPSGEADYGKNLRD